MFIKIVSFTISSYLLSMQAWADTNSVEFLNYLLKTKQPYADYVKKTVDDEDCRLDLKEDLENYKRECEDTQKLVFDEKKSEELKEILATHKDYIKKHCREQNYKELPSELKELCFQFKDLEKFIHISNTLESCKSSDSDSSLNSQIDRAINAASNEAVGKQDICGRGLDDSKPLNQPEEDFAKGLSRVLEEKEFKQLNDFLIEDALNESVKGSLVFGAAIGESEGIDLDRHCLKQENYSGSYIGPINPKTEEVCGDENREYVKKLTEKQKDISADTIGKQNLEESRDVINHKINELNEILKTRNERIENYDVALKKAQQQAIDKYRERKPWGLISAKEVFYSDNRIKKIFDREILANINSEYLAARNAVLNDQKVVGTDELYQTDVLRKHLKLANPGEKKIEPIKPLTAKKLRSSFKEAKNRSDKQVAELIKMKKALREKEQKSDSNLSYSQRKKELAKLVRTNPVSIGRALIRFPELSNNICAISKTIKSQDDLKRNIDTAFIVVGVGIGAATIIGTLGAATPAAAGLVFFTGAAAGSVYGVSDAVYSHQRAKRTEEELDANIAAGLLRLGDEKTLGKTFQLTSEVRTLNIRRNLSVALLPLEALGAGAVTRPVRISRSLIPKSPKEIKKFEKITKSAFQESDLSLWRKANEVLGDEKGLTFEQFELVRRAHEVGRGEEGLIPGTIAGIGNYTAPQRIEKARLLKKAKLSIKQRRLLFEAGVVGDEVDIRSVSLHAAFEKTLPPKLTGDDLLIEAKDVLARNKEVKNILDEKGIEVELIPGTGADAQTTLLADAKPGLDPDPLRISVNVNGKPVPEKAGPVPDGYSLDTRSFSPEYGVRYRVNLEKLKDIESAGSSPTDFALTHPEFKEYIERLERLGVKVDIDTTIGYKTPAKAQYQPRVNTIKLSPESDWTTFLHEFQHAEFQNLINKGILQEEELVKLLADGTKIKVKKLKINPKFKDSFEAEVKASGSNYSDVEISLIKSNIKRGETSLATNEELSHLRQLSLFSPQDQKNLSRSNNRKLHSLWYKVDELEKLRRISPKAFDDIDGTKKLAAYYDEYDVLQWQNIAREVAGDLAIVSPAKKIKNFEKGNLDELKQKYPKLGDSIEADREFILSQKFDKDHSLKEIKEGLSKLNLDEKLIEGLLAASDLLHSQRQFADYFTELQADVAKVMEMRGQVEMLKSGSLDPQAVKDVLEHRAAINGLDIVQIDSFKAVKDDVERRLRDLGESTGRYRDKKELEKASNFISGELFSEEGVGKGVIFTDRAFDPADPKSIHSLVAHLIQQDYTYKTVQEVAELDSIADIPPKLGTSEGAKAWNLVYDSTSKIKTGVGDNTRRTRSLSSPEHFKTISEKTNGLGLLEKGHYGKELPRLGVFDFTENLKQFSFGGRSIPSDEIDAFIERIPISKVESYNPEDLNKLGSYILGDKVTVERLNPTDVNPLSGADVYRVKDEAKNTISFLKLYTEDSAAKSAHELLGQTNLKGNSYDVSSPQTIVSIDVNGKKRIGLFLKPAEGSPLVKSLETGDATARGTKVGEAVRELSLTNRAKVADLSPAAEESLKNVRKHESSRVDDVTNTLDKLVESDEVSADFAKTLRERIQAKSKGYENSLPEESAIIHYDLHPGNVLVKDEKVSIIDLDGAVWSIGPGKTPVGDPLNDFSKLYYGIKYNCPGGERCAELAESVKTAYFKGDNARLEKEFIKHQDFYELRSSTQKIKHKPDCETFKATFLAFETFVTAEEIENNINCK